MGRKKRRGGFSSFAQGFALGESMVNKWNDAQAKNEMADIGRAQEETDTGFTADQGEQLQQAAESGNTITYDDASKSYVITSKDGGEVQNVNQATRGVNFLGKTYEEPLNDQQKDRARMQAMAGVMQKFGKPEEAIRLRQQVTQAEQMDKQGKMMDIQLKGAEAEQAFKDGLPDLMKGSRFAQAQAEGRKYSIADSLADNASFLAYGTKFGKADPKEWMSLAANMQKVEEEGYHKALTLADSGATLDQVAKVFNSSGKVQFDPAAVISDKPGTIKLRGQDVPTRIIQYKDANGNVQTINTAAELAGLGEAKSLLDMHFAGNRDKNDAKRVGFEGARVDIAREEATDRKTAKADAEQEKKEKADAAVKLYKDKNPNATSAEIEAVRTGVMSALPKEAKNEFSATTDSMGVNITRTNKDTGAVDIIDGRTGKVKSTIPAPGAQQGAGKPTAVKKGQRYTDQETGDVYEASQDGDAKDQNIWKKVGGSIR